MHEVLCKTQNKNPIYDCTQTNPFPHFMARFVLLGNLSVTHHSCKQQTLLRHLFNFLHDKVPASQQSIVLPQRCTQRGQLLPWVLAAGSGVFPSICTVWHVLLLGTNLIFLKLLAFYLFGLKPPCN